MRRPRVLPAWALAALLAACATQDPEALGPRVPLGALVRAWRAGEVAVVDPRGDGAYVGWPPPGAARRGHVPGAVQVDPAWFRGAAGAPVPDKAIRGVLSARPLPADRPLVVVGDDPADASRVARALEVAGRSGVSVLAEPFRSWIDDPSLPLEECPGWAALVDPVWVRELVEGRAPPT